MADWSCTSCTYLNKSTATECNVCGVDRPRPGGGGDRPHLESPAELKKIALELTPLVINPPSPRSMTPGGPNTPRSKTVNLSEKVKVKCPFCTIEQGVGFRDIQIKCYMCAKTFPNPLMADGGGGGGSPSPRNAPSPRFDRPNTLTLSPKSQFDRPPSFDREPSRIASPSLSQQSPQQPLLLNPQHHHHQSSFSQPQHSPSHHAHHSSFSVSPPKTPVHGHQSSVSLNTVNVKCPKCGTVMSVPQGSSMVQCPNCQSPLSRSPSFEQQQPFLQPQRVLSTPSPRHSPGLGPQQNFTPQQQQQPMIPRLSSAPPLGHPTPGGGYVSVPQVPRPLTPVQQQPQSPQSQQGGPRQRVTVGAGDDLPVVAHELEVDLTPEHYSPLNHPAYGKLGAIQKLKFCYLYLGGLILFFYSLASNAVFLNNVPAIIHNYVSVDTLLDDCCGAVSPNNMTNDSGYCCGNTARFTCCDCRTWIADAKDGNCPENQMCERFYESLIPSPPLGLKTVLSYDPFSKCHPSALSTHYKCPDESCLSDPPAIYIYGFNVAYAMLITSQVLLVISRIFTEILYYQKSYKTEQYHATESILGCFWFCRNKHYQNFILEEKMKYEISCIGFWLGVCVRIDNLVTHIFLVGAYASPYFKNTKLILAIVSVFVDIGQIFFDALGFFFQCCAKSCKRGEEHVDCRCKGRNCLEFSFLIVLIIGSGVVLTISFGRLYTA